MPSAVKVALLIVGIIVSILVYTITYASISCALTHSRAFGLGVLWNNPLYWLVMALIVGAEVWAGKHLLWK